VATCRRLTAANKGFEVEPRLAELEGALAVLVAEPRRLDVSPEAAGRSSVGLE
jgi:hypothetical protein